MDRRVRIVFLLLFITNYSYAMEYTTIQPTYLGTSQEIQIAAKNNAIIMNKNYYICAHNNWNPQEIKEAPEQLITPISSRSWSVYSIKKPGEQEKETDITFAIGTQSKSKNQELFKMNALFVGPNQHDRFISMMTVNNTQTLMVTASSPSDSLKFWRNKDDKWYWVADLEQPENPDVIDQLAMSPNNNYVVARLCNNIVAAWILPAIK